MRAAIEHGGIGKETFCRAAEKRLCTRSTSPARGAGDELTEANAALGVGKPQ